MYDPNLDNEENKDNVKDLIVQYLGNNGTVNLPRPDEILSPSEMGVDPNLVDQSLKDMNATRAVNDAMSVEDPTQVSDFFAIGNEPPEPQLSTDNPLGMSEASPNSWEGTLENIYNKVYEMTDTIKTGHSNAEQRASELLNIPGLMSPAPGLPEDTVFAVTPDPKKTGNIGGKGVFSSMLNQSKVGPTLQAPPTPPPQPPAPVVEKGPGIFSRAMKGVGKLLSRDKSVPQVVVNNPPPPGPSFTDTAGKVILGGAAVGAPFIATEEGREELGHWTKQGAGYLKDKVFPNNDIIRSEPQIEFGNFKLTDRPSMQERAYEMGNNRDNYIRKSQTQDALEYGMFIKQPIRPLKKESFGKPDKKGRAPEEVIRNFYGKAPVNLDIPSYDKLDKNALRFVDLIDEVGKYANIAGKLNFESPSVIHKYNSPPNYQPEDLQKLKALQEKIVTILGEADLTGVMTDRDIDRVRTYIAPQPGEAAGTVTQKVENLMLDMENSFNKLPPNVQQFVLNRYYEEQAVQLLGRDGIVKDGVVYINSPNGKDYLPIPVEMYLEMKKANGAPVELNIFPWERKLNSKGR